VLIIPRFVFGQRESNVRRSNRVIAMSLCMVPAQFGTVGIRRSDRGGSRLRSSGGLTTHV
jgi:hypothetical protein